MTTGWRLEGTSSTPNKEVLYQSEHLITDEGGTWHA